MLVCGDDAVGKTSIIDTLFSGCFSKDVEEVKGRLNANGSWGEVVIPGQINSQTDVQVNLVVVDTSARTANKRMEVLTKMKEADVVVLVYAVDNEDTFNQLEDHWLQPIQRVCQQHYDNKVRFSPSVPIVLVGNKIDKRAGDNTVDRSGALQNKVMPILEKYPEVEACLECSAAALLNIRQVFYFAQKAVIYPLKPLYNMKEACLQDDFRVALKRVFRIFDCDKDGFLSDEELNLFQVQCFAAQMEPSDIAAVKKALQSEASEGMAIVNDKITLEGFIQLNTMFILRNRPESSWMLLRHFGYERDGDIGLHMILEDAEDSEALAAGPSSFWTSSLSTDPRAGSPALDNSQCLPPLRKDADQNTELSSDALAFLESLFKQYKEDADNDAGELLRESRLEEIFEVTPENPWRTDPRYNFPNGVEYLMVPVQSNAAAEPASSSAAARPSEDLELALPRSSWLSMWSMMAAIDARATMRYMWYLGFPGNALERGSIAKQIHLKWPANKLHLGQAIRVTAKRSGVKTAKTLDRKMIRCFLFGDSPHGRSMVLGSLAGRDGTDAYGAANDGSDFRIELGGDGSARAGGGRNGDMDLDGMMDEEDDYAYSRSTSDHSSLREQSAVRWYSPEGGDEVALMVTDMGRNIPVPADRLDACDVVCMVFDTAEPKSLSYLRDLQARIPDHIPCVYVGMQDETSGGDDVMDGVAQLCNSYKLDAPFVVSRKANDPALETLFEDIVMSALNPDIEGKRPISQEKQRQLAQRRMIMKYSLLGIGISVVVGLGYLFLRKKNDSASSVTGKEGAKDAVGEKAGRK